ncbi:DUF397 domain-containing protein [Streptomyces tateyamensis]|uniref:DUF397 domain-containing protein n=1 Tax=Streptomyces tateyamensis TaxID=565073 RepID=A0A2V4NU92_9ACTN|nr:DUF397 domain-containing protein [Streptomyces tateyamensis]PYC80234.1 DUF397 domain-containing protein [Streptomyces tateyamensis]
MDTSSARWQKSSYSQQGGNCLEIARGLRGVMPVRDSKDPHGPALAFPAPSWTDFLAGLKAGAFRSS